MTTIQLELDGESTPALQRRYEVVAQAARYLVASLAALALDASLLGLCAGPLGIWSAGAVGYAAGLALIYRLSTRWVFPDRVVGDRRKEFLLFAALGVIGLVVNCLILVTATSAGLALPWAKAVAAAIGFATNFATRKLLLFTRRT